MSRATLTSINKPHTDNIFTDEPMCKKTVEWRTKPLPLGLHYVYETKNKGGCGKVIGEMTIVENIKFADVSAIPHETILKGRVGARQLDLYAKNRPLYANVIANAKLYDKPKELGEFYKVGKNDACVNGQKTCLYARITDFCRSCEFTIKTPPQSWCYVEV